MHWHEAAHTVQAHWRGRRDPRLHNLQKSGADAGVPAGTAKPQRAVAGAASAGAPPSPSAASSTADGEAAAATAASDGSADNGAAAASGTAGGAASTSPGMATVARGGSGAAHPNGRLTVNWRPELAEIRTYSVSMPMQPRW